jgi:hypothetical protein
MGASAASTQGLARRLLALEAALPPAATDAAPQPAVRVCEKLRLSLSRFAGADGFTALLRRALALARADEPTVAAVKVLADGRLEGLEKLFAGADERGLGSSIAIVAHLLRLLVTFIGAPLTLRLVREAWPDLAPDEWQKIEDK